ncbi:HDOD domain-containing protein [Azoarcus sp. KH32C]|uniref:HDOD domain-containing protein n=1 Tax=Azoarcus sp. KH32C TaxID=748247 RepID=UPI0002386FC6|nr:HDOD domain-containing protein [Azoarcus sp. KH32C]BAL23435.1 hypothetical protein AZKH_1105 [Azoarcus sp. KH32C]
MNSCNSRTHRFLLQIAEDLSSGDVSFPTYLDAAVRIRLALEKPDLTIDTLARVLLTEPLVSAKVIRLANSAALNPSGREVTDVKTAVMRVGFSAIRALAVSVALQQLLREKDMAPFMESARALWQHSLEVAAASFVVARRLTKIRPDEALFAGLVHDIGHFYLLSQIARNPEIARDDEELYRVLDEWHCSIGHAVLSALETPESILTAVKDHETAFADQSPTSLGQVLYIANTLAPTWNPFAGASSYRSSPVLESVASIIGESSDELNSIIAALGH